LFLHSLVKISVASNLRNMLIKPSWNTMGLLLAMFARPQVECLSGC
jgi:hypothetical protein